MNTRNLSVIALAAAVLAPFAGSGGGAGADRPRKLRQKGEDRYAHNTTAQYPPEFWQAAHERACDAHDADMAYRKDKRAAKRNARPTNWKSARKELKKRHQQPRREKVKL